MTETRSKNRRSRSGIDDPSFQTLIVGVVFGLVHIFSSYGASCRERIEPFFQLALQWFCGVIRVLGTAAISRKEKNAQFDRRSSMFDELIRTPLP